MPEDPEPSGAGELQDPPVENSEPSVSAEERATQGRKPSRATSEFDDTPSTFQARELFQLTKEITGGQYRRSYAAGALRHARINLDDQITREQFLQALADYATHPAFSGGQK